MSWSRQRVKSQRIKYRPLRHYSAELHFWRVQNKKAKKIYKLHYLPRTQSLKLHHISSMDFISFVLIMNNPFPIFFSGYGYAIASTCSVVPHKYVLWTQKGSSFVSDTPPDFLRNRTLGACVDFSTRLYVAIPGSSSLEWAHKWSSLQEGPSSVHRLLFSLGWSVLKFPPKKGLFLTSSVVSLFGINLMYALMQ